MTIMGTPSSDTASIPHSNGLRRCIRMSTSEHTRKPTACAERIRPQPLSPMSLWTASTGPSVLKAPAVIALSRANDTTTTHSHVVEVR